MRHIPREIVDFTERLLTDRKTQLRFDGHTSNWIPINNGIGQGDPLVSMILYVIYASGLVDIAKTRRNREALKELTLAFVDDTALIAIGKDFDATHAILKDMLERENGAIQWSRDHNSRFETSKFALMDFSMNRNKTRPPMNIQGTLIKPTATHRFLGVIVDQELRWNHQVDNAIARGTAYVTQLRRLTKATKGLPMRLTRQLYQAIAIPKMLYAANIWFKPIYQHDSNTRQRGSIGIAKKLTSVQRSAAIAITGAMRTTATDILEAHANLLPVPLLLQITCHRAIVRLTTHPSTHPLHAPIRKAAKHFVSSHRSSLHHLTNTFSISPDDIESINPVRRPPTSRIPVKTSIAKSKEEAIAEHFLLSDEIQIYCDGSGYRGKIGAAAIMFRKDRRPRILKYHLGEDSEHTVYEAEEVGLILAAHLLATERDLPSPISISIDNQAALQSIKISRSSPSSYLADNLIKMLKKLTKDHRNLDITFRWVPGHEGVHGNEEVDKAAKSAAEGEHQNSPAASLPRILRQGTLPLSISALIQAQRKEIQNRWAQQWRKSPRYHHMQSDAEHRPQTPQSLIPQTHRQLP